MSNRRILPCFSSDQIFTLISEESHLLDYINLCVFQVYALAISSPLYPFPTAIHRLGNIALSKIPRRRKHLVLRHFPNLCLSVLPGGDRRFIREGQRLYLGQFPVFWR